MTSSGPTWKSLVLWTVDGSYAGPPGHGGTAARLRRPGSGPGPDPAAPLLLGLRRRRRPGAAPPRAHHCRQGRPDAGLLIKRITRIALNFATLRTTGSGSCCTAMWSGTLTRRHESEAGHHVQCRRRGLMRLPAQGALIQGLCVVPATQVAMPQDQLTMKGKSFTPI